MIWRTWDDRLKRHVAVKSLSAELTSSEEAEARFLREAQTLSHLQHPGVISIYDLFDADDPPCFTCELVATETTLAKIITSRREVKQRLPELIGVLLQVAETIAYAHSRGVVHRDLKPSNIMVGDFGQVLVMDWGLSAHLQEASPEPLPIVNGEQRSSIRSISHPGQVLGTLAYLAPEQAATGTPFADPRVDVYGLGAILYAILTGLPPHGRLREDAGSVSPEDLLVRVRTEPPPSPSTVWPEAPAELVACCTRALQRSPEQRYQSAREFRNDLREYVQGGLLSAARYTVPQRIWKWAKIHKWGIAVATTILLSCVLGTGWLYSRTKRRSDNQAATKKLHNSQQLTSTVSLHHIAKEAHLLAQQRYDRGEYEVSAKLLDHAIKCDSIVRTAVAKGPIFPSPTGACSA